MTQIRVKWEISLLLTHLEYSIIILNWLILYLQSCFVRISVSKCYFKFNFYIYEFVNARMHSWVFVNNIPQMTILLSKDHILGQIMLLELNDVINRTVFLVFWSVTCPIFYSFPDRKQTSLLFNKYCVRRISDFFRGMWSKILRVQSAKILGDCLYSTSFPPFSLVIILNL